jgi:cholesterol oxidase
MDYDWLIIGSGFGGSVSALRLSEKGYKVGVIEAGRRFEDEDFAKSSWQLNRYLWAPFLGLRGIMRFTPFKDIFIASGAGVGGGSIVYANTLYRAKSEFFQNPQWAALGDWQQELDQHYATAEHMLGVNTVPFESAGDKLLQDYAASIGVEDTFRRTPVAVYFGDPGKEVADPFFDGAGPARTGCIRCGACMIGCRVGAKNTLLKNYLWFAEKLGAKVLPNRKVVDIRPLNDANGRDGYEVRTRSSGMFGGKEKILRAQNVIVSAGALGTNQLLADCKHSGSLPKISNQLGQLVRTNSESILGVTIPDESLKLWQSVAISSSIHTDADTHIEVVTYGEKGDVLSFLMTLITGDGTRWTRFIIAKRAASSDPVSKNPVAIRLVKKIDRLARNAKSGQRDFVSCQEALVRRRCATQHGTERRQTEPHLYRSRKQSGCVDRRADRWHCSNRCSGSGTEYSDNCAHTRRCGNW